MRREWNSHAIYQSSPAERIKPHAKVFAIDFVYCWAGEAVQQDDEGKTLHDITGTDRSHGSGHGFGELRYSIRFLEAYAPWFHKVYILVNRPVKRPTWLTEASKHRVIMIDRCTLFDRSQDCPTQNDAACSAVMHKIPGLSEHFVAMDDDFLVLHPLTPSDFFSSHEGKPFVLPPHAQYHVSMYEKMPRGPDMPPKSIPGRMFEFHHFPCPNWVSFAWQLEHKYPEWYAFVRSHRHRFVCCNASINKGSGLDEEFHRIYPHMLLKLGVGIHRPVKTQETCDPERQISRDAFRRCFIKKLLKPQLQFMVLQNIFDVGTWDVVQEALRRHIRKMPESKLVSLSSDSNDRWSFHLPGVSWLQDAGSSNSVTFLR